jgi:hypothetical protein
MQSLTIFEELYKVLLFYGVQYYILSGVPTKDWQKHDKIRFVRWVCTVQYGPQTVGWTLAPTSTSSVTTECDPRRKSCPAVPVSHANVGSHYFDHALDNRPKSCIWKCDRQPSLQRSCERCVAWRIDPCYKLRARQMFKPLLQILPINHSSKMMSKTWCLRDIPHRIPVPSCSPNSLCLRCMTFPQFCCKHLLKYPTAGPRVSSVWTVTSRARVSLQRIYQTRQTYPRLTRLDAWIKG